MKEVLEASAYFGFALSLLCYQIGLWVKKKVSWPIANPLLVGVILAIGILVIFDIDYDTYYNGAKYINIFLTPATVCLAIPLYRQIAYLRKYPKAIFGGVGVGVLMSLGSNFLMSLAFGLTHEQYATLLPKAITTAIGMGLSEKIGGISSITVTCIFVCGLTGNMIAEPTLRLFHIEEPVAKGLAIGTSSHALGTAKAIELGQVEGAMSSLSIVVAGIMTVIAAQFFANFL